MTYLHDMKENAKNEAKSHLLSMSYRSCPETAFNTYYELAAVEILISNGYKPVPHNMRENLASWKNPQGITVCTRTDFHRGAYEMVRLHILPRERETN